MGNTLPVLCKAVVHVAAAFRSLDKRKDIGNNWTFWQYSDTGKLSGYTGDEPCIDLNVFHGSMKELEFFIN